MMPNVDIGTLFIPIIKGGMEIYQLLTYLVSRNSKIVIIKINSKIQEL